MKKLIIFLMVMMLIPTVLADIDSDLYFNASLLAYYDNGLGDDASTNDFKGTPLGNPVQDTSEFFVGNASVLFSDAQAIIFGNDSSGTLFAANPSGFTFCTGMKYNDDNDVNWIAGQYDGGAVGDWRIGIRGDLDPPKTVGGYSGSGFTAALDTFAPQLATDTWNHFCVGGNQTGSAVSLQSYINATELETVTGGAGSTTASDEPIYLGCNGAEFETGGADDCFNGNLDESYLWNRTLTDAEILRVFQIWVSNANLEPPSVNNPPNAPVILFPIEDKLTNQDPLVINITIGTDPESDLVDEMFVYINGTLNLTVNLNTTSPNQSIAIGEGRFSMQVSTKTVDNLQSANATIDLFIIDRTNPFDDLATQIPDGTGFITSINVSITASNTNLFGHNVTIYRQGTNEILFSEEVLNISQPINVIIAIIDVATFGAGTFDMFSNESDDHTEKAIKNYNVNPNTASKKLSFDTGVANIDVQVTKAERVLTNDNHVSILNQLTALGANKRTDRYNFEFNFNADPASVDHYEFTIVVTSDIKAYIRNTEFQGHLVLGDEHWLDFEGEMITSVSVTQISDNVYEFLIISTSPNLLFESIGGTNQAGTHITFTIDAPSVSSLECETPSAFDTCSNLNEGQTLLQVRTTCTNGTSATMTLIKAGVPLFTDQTATKVGDIFTFNNANELLTEVAYNLSAVCTNDVGTSFLDTIFTPSEVIIAPEDDPNTLSGFAKTGTRLLTLIIIVGVLGLIFFNIISRFKKQK